MHARKYDPSGCADLDHLYPEHGAAPIRESQQSIPSLMSLPSQLPPNSLACDMYPSTGAPYAQPTYRVTSNSYTHQQPAYTNYPVLQAEGLRSSSRDAPPPNSRDAPPPYSVVMGSSQHSPGVPHHLGRQMHADRESMKGIDEFGHGKGRRGDMYRGDVRGDCSKQVNPRDGHEASMEDAYGDRVRTRDGTLRGVITGETRSVDRARARGGRGIRSKHSGRGGRKENDSPHCSTSPSFFANSECRSVETHDGDKLAIESDWNIENWLPEAVDTYDKELWSQDMEEFSLTASEVRCSYAVLVSGQLKPGSRCALQFYMEAVAGVDVLFMAFSADGQRAALVFNDNIDLEQLGMQSNKSVAPFSVELTFSEIKQPSFCIMWLGKEQINSEKQELFTANKITDVKHLEEFQCMIGTCDFAMTQPKPLHLDSQTIVWPLFTELGLVRSKGYYMQPEYEAHVMQEKLPLMWVGGLSKGADQEMLRKFFIIEKMSGGDRTAEIGPSLSDTERLLKYDTPTAYSSVMRKACDQTLTDPNKGISDDGNLHVALRIEVPSPDASSQFLVLRDIPKRITKEYLWWFLSSRTHNRVSKIYFTEDGCTCLVLFQDSGKFDLDHLQQSLQKIREVSGMIAWQVPPVVKVKVSGVENGWTRERLDTELTRWTTDHNLSRLAVFSYEEQCPVISSVDAEGAGAIAAFLMRDPGELNFGAFACEIPQVPILQERQLFRDRLDTSVCLDFLQESQKKYFLLPDVKNKLLQSHDAMLTRVPKNVVANCTLRPSSAPHHDFVKRLSDWRECLLQEIQSLCNTLEELDLSINKTDLAKIDPLRKSLVLQQRRDGSNIFLNALGSPSKIAELKEALASAGTVKQDVELQTGSCCLPIPFREAKYFRDKGGRLVAEKYPQVNVKVNTGNQKASLNFKGDESSVAEAQMYVKDLLASLASTSVSYKKELLQFITSAKTSEYLSEMLRLNDSIAFFDGKDYFLNLCAETDVDLEKAVQLIRSTVVMREFPVNSPSSKAFFLGESWDKVKEELDRKCNEQNPPLPVVIKRQGGVQPDKVEIYFVSEAKPLVKQYIEDKLQSFPDNIQPSDPNGPEKKLKITFSFVDFQYFKFFFFKKQLPESKVYQMIEFDRKTYQMIASGPQDIMNELDAKIRQMKKSLHRGHLFIRNASVVPAIAGLDRTSKPMKQIDEASSETETAYVINSVHLVQKFEMFTPLRMISVCKGSIMCLSADAVLMAVSPTLNSDTTEVGRNLHLADPDLRERLTQHLANGEIATGSCLHFHNPQGDLPFKQYMVLVLGRESLTSLQQSMNAALSNISEMGLSSVALNLLGSDGLKVDPKGSASVIIQSLEHYFEENPTSTLQSVCFCETTPAKVEIIKAELERMEVTQQNFSNPNKLLDTVFVQLVSNREQNIAKFKSRLEALSELQA